jgi:hypothetical protein
MGSPGARCITMKDMMVMPRKVGPRVRIFLSKYRNSAILENDYTAKSDFAQNSPHHYAIKKTIMVTIGG